jgi:hypothetical protein
LVWWAVEAGAAEAVDLELVLAADGSGSIDEDELHLQRAGYAAAITHPRVLNALRSGFHQAVALAYIEWGGPDSQHTIVDWHVIRDAASAQVFADKLLAAPRMAAGYNSISGAIDYAADLIRTNAYAGNRKIIDVSGDGPQIGGRPIELSRGEAVADDITINALVVKSAGGGYRGPGGMPLDMHYRLDVIGGRGAFVMVAEDRQDFARAVLNKLLLEIAGGGDAAERRRAGALESLSGRDCGPPVVRRARAGADPWVRCHERQDTTAPAPRGG